MDLKQAKHQRSGGPRSQIYILNNRACIALSVDFKFNGIGEVHRSS